MNPSIKPGDLVIIYNLNKNYVRGDVILTSNKQLFRIIAAYKDEITIDENNRLLINGQVMEEEIYFDTFINKESKVKYPLKMKKNEYFVLNDYRMDDKDSRYFGSIKLSDIKGLVISNIRIRGI